MLSFNKIRDEGWMLAVVATAALVPALAACQATAAPAPASAAQAPAPAAAPQQDEEVKLIVNEWRFDPGKLQLPAGRPVKITLENKGNLEHDIYVPALKLKLTAKPGQTASTTVTAEQAGDYEYLCSVPGHKEAGMKGALTVAHGVAAGALASATTGAAPAAAHASHAASVSTEKHGNQPLPYRMEGDTKVFDITAQHVQWEVLPDEHVDAYAYNGQVPGPVMRVTEGEKFRLDFTNTLPEDTVVHFHGPSLPNSMDGVPDVTQATVKPGEKFSYQFVAKPAGTFMYHTHHNSAVQEPKGLYGLFIIEPKDGGKQVEYDQEIFQVLSEIEGYFVINGKAFPATEPVEAKVGEKILVRLVNLGQMPHPMHLHGHPFKIVATDGYPVPEAAQLTKDVVTIGPGERYDLLVELDNPGTWVFHCHILSHVQNHGVEPGGMLTVIKVTE